MRFIGIFRNFIFASVLANYIFLRIFPFLSKFLNLSAYGNWYSLILNVYFIVVMSTFSFFNICFTRDLLILLVFILFYFYLYYFYLFHFGTWNLYFFHFLKFYCSSTVVCLSPPPLPLTPDIPPSLPWFHTPLGFVHLSFIVVPENASPFSPHYSFPSPLWLLFICS